MITSMANQKIKRILELQKHSKARYKEGLFVAEGIRLFEEIPDELIEAVYYTDAFALKYDNKERLARLNNETVEESIFKKISDTVNPQGVMALVRFPKWDADAILSEENTLLLCLENVQDPGNLGTMIRTSEAAGVRAVFATKDSVDVFSPKVVRSTMGAIFRVPVIYIEDIAAMEKMLLSAGVSVYAAALSEKNEYTDVDYRGKCAILIGNEGNGLSDAAITGATSAIKIPMEGRVESLNAAVSAAVIMYEAKRQRNVVGL